MGGFLLRKWLRKILTKTVTVQTDIHRKKVKRAQIPPNEKLVYSIYFAMMALGCLTLLEVTYMIVFRQFNSEIFSAITGLSGTILGVFLGTKA